MMEIKHRDGVARYGFLKIDEMKIEIPNIIFVPTSKLKIPKSAVMVERLKPEEGEKFLQIQPLGDTITNVWMSGSANFHIPIADPIPASFEEAPPVCYGKWCVVYGKEEGEIEVPNKKGCIFTLANAPVLFPKSKIFLRNILRLREKIGYSSLIHLPAVASPSNLALLVYMGVDLVDTIYITIAARNGYMLFPEGSYHFEEVEENLCSCPACVKKEGMERVVWHNYYSLLQEMERIRLAIRGGRLRELVEQRILAEPHLTEKYRIMHLEHYRFVERRFPVTRQRILIASSRDSIDYPEVRRFRERVIERYEKPKFARIALFLPCSSKKPYSVSKSHTILKKVISSTGCSGVIHEIVVTSPLGLVPRELEIVYPAIKYDIPVTGKWYGEEKEMIRDVLKEYLHKNKYDIFISHLPGEINEVLREVCSELIETCVGHPLSKESLNNLRDELEKVAENYERVEIVNKYLEVMKKVASFQFGFAVAEDLVREGCRVEGDYPSLKLMDGANLLASLSKERGLLSLTLEGGKVLEKAGVYTVDVEGVKSKGSVFASDVVRADDNIRVGDDVAVLSEGKLYAVGIARMNGEEMEELERGEAVRIRHHV